MSIEIPQSKPEKYPVFKQFFFLITVTLLSLLIFPMLGARIAASLFHIDLLSLFSPDYSHADQNLINALKFLNTFYMVGVFLTPALLLAYYNRSKPLAYINLDKKISLTTVFQIILLLILMFPFLDWFIDFNNRMTLPDSMNTIEKWMRLKENEAVQLTDIFLKMNNIGGLLVNMVVIALIPAMLEEIYFRGILQKMLHNWLGNIHLTVIITAILFSAVHMQFFGFLPRVLLGLVLGYFFYWTGSLWAPVFVHFLNNAVTVIVVYLSHNHLINYETNTPMVHSNLVTIVSFGIAAVFFLFLANYYNKRRKNKSDWAMIYTASTLTQAEIIKGKLENEDIEAVIMNKRDSSYQVFGPVEIYVKPENEQRAKEIIQNEDFTPEENIKEENNENE
jgi:uncharacterized protein